MAYHVVGTRRYFEQHMNHILKSGKLPSPNEWCFASFNRRYEDFTELHQTTFTALILNTKVNRVIRDFNRRFSNITIKKYFVKKFTEFDNWEKVWREYGLSWHNEFDGDAKDCCLYVLYPAFSKEYNWDMRYHLYVPLIQFFRQFSPQERYSSHYRMAMNVPATINGLLKGHAKYDARHEYGNWCSCPVSLDEFMLMDDPAVVKKATSSKRRLDYYATQLFYRLSSVNKK